MFLVMAGSSRLLDPGDDFPGNLFGGEILLDARLALLFWRTGTSVADSLSPRGSSFGALQRGHDRAHVGHSDLRVVAGFREITGCPAQQRRRALTKRNLVTAAFDAFQNFKRAIRLHGKPVDSLELIENAEAFADQLHRDARAA